MTKDTSASTLTPHVTKPAPEKVTIRDIIENIHGNGRDYVVRYRDDDLVRTAIGEIAAYDGRFVTIVSDMGVLHLSIEAIVYLRRGGVRCRY